MALSPLPSLLLLTLLLLSLATPSLVQAQLDQTSMLLMSEALEWPSTTMSDLGESIDDEEDGGAGRRSLFWRRVHYYISYGALSANRIPCPPRSGRSYYTHNCYKARGPVHPYNRGCSKITRCRR